MWVLFYWLGFFERLAVMALLAHLASFPVGSFLGSFLRLFFEIRFLFRLTLLGV